MDRTKYPEDQVPELAVCQIFGRQKLESDLCLLLAASGLTSIERLAMLGASISSVKTTVKAIVDDETKFGNTAAKRELALTQLAAVWKAASTLQEHVSARRARMEEEPNKVPEIPGEDHAEFREVFVQAHPDMLLTYHREPHRKFVERIHRDYMVHGAVAFYEVAEMRVRSETIVQTANLAKTSEDLLRVVQVDAKGAVSSESNVMDRLHAFFMALEYLNVCEFSTAAGPLRYLAELEEWRHENRGWRSCWQPTGSFAARSAHSTTTVESRSALSLRPCSRFSPTTSSCGMMRDRLLSSRSFGRSKLKWGRRQRSGRGRAAR